MQSWLVVSSFKQHVQHNKCLHASSTAWSTILLQQLQVTSAVHKPNPPAGCERNLSVVRGTEHL